jgi:hypothetical protein
MLLPAFSNAYIFILLIYALSASCYDMDSTLGAVATLGHPTAKGCSSPLQQPRTHFTASLLAVNLLLAAFRNAYVFPLRVYALVASCYDMGSSLGAVAALGNATEG